jgi:hypothetical protein
MVALGNGDPGYRIFPAARILDFRLVEAVTQHIQSFNRNPWTCRRFSEP